MVTGPVPIVPELTGPEPRSLTPVIVVIDAGRVADDEFVTNLAAEGFQVRLAGSGAQGLELVDGVRPDAVLCGTGLPDVSTVALIRLLRDRSAAPILAVSDGNDETEVVLALETGASDFLGSPRRSREVAARIWLSLRRREGGVLPPPPVPAPPLESVGRSPALAAGPVEIDLERRQLRIRGVPVHARPKELELLRLLVAASGAAISRQEAMDALWPRDRPGRSKNLDAHIHRIRTLVELDPAQPRHVVTVRGYGHRFDA